MTNQYALTTQGHHSAISMLLEYILASLNICHFLRTAFKHVS